MASSRRGSEGDLSKSKKTRSVSATRRFFESFRGQNKSEEGNPDIEVDVSVQNGSRSVSPSAYSNSETESEAPSEQSSQSEIKRKNKKDTKEKVEKVDKTDYSRSREKAEKAERDKQKRLEAKYMEYTRSNPLGSALLDMVADNMALHRKLNFKESNLRVGDLCAAFHEHMESEKQKIRKELEAASEETEMRILDKELHAYKCKENLPSPKNYSSRNVLNTASARAEAIRIFPTKNKFNGTESSNGMNIHEFLSLINAAQKQMNLSREEFLEFLLMCTTGRPHMLIKDWSENGDGIEEIYYNLFTHYDMRMSPETAREKLSVYKARKNSNLSKVTSDIMQLALRAACVLPPGVTRTASYNSEAIQALIRSLPPMASDTASNKYHTISSRLQRPATFVELSRALSINAHTIDAEIARAGAPPGHNNFGGKTYHNYNGNGTHKGNKDKKPRSQNTAYTVNAKTGQHKESRHSSTPHHGQRNQKGRTEVFYNQNGSAQNGHNNDRNRGASNGNRNNDRNRNGNGQNRGNSSNRYNNSNGYRGNGNRQNHNNRQGYRTKNYCSLCGYRDHLATDGCPYIQDDHGKVIKVLPCQTTCPDCPSTVNPRLNHSATYCPFRISGPLHGTK
jgi:hypothetical protein